MNGAVVRGDRVDRSPTVQKLGRAVLLQGQAVVDTHLVFELGIQRAGRDGINPARLAPLRSALAAAAAEVRATSGVGHADVRDEPSAPVSEPTAPLTTREVATMLDISSRQAQRLAATLEARRLRTGVLVFDRYTVEAYIADRERVAA